MGVSLSISVTSPLEPEDRELLTGLSIMVMAIANHELAKAHFPGTFPDDEELAGMAEEAAEGAQEASHRNGLAQADEPQACAKPDGEGRVCISEIGHRGRHRFRAVVPMAGGLN